MIKSKGIYMINEKREYSYYLIKSNRNVPDKRTPLLRLAKKITYMYS